MIVDKDHDLRALNSVLLSLLVGEGIHAEVWIVGE